MDNFLKKIKASDKLKKEFSNASLKAFNNNKNNKIRLIIKNSDYLSPDSNIELFSKTILKFNEMDLSFEFINFEKEHKNDLLNTYENIIKYIDYRDFGINKSNFIISFENNLLIIKCSNDETFDLFSKLKKDLNLYLDHFSICNLLINININKQILGSEKLKNEIKKDILDNLKKEKSINEDIWNKKKKIDFSLNEEQKNVYFEGEVFNFEQKILNNGTTLYKFSIGRGDLVVNSVVFDKKNKGTLIKNGDLARVYGTYEFDEYTKSYILKLFSPEYIQLISYTTLNNIEVNDNEIPRNEFHIHTKMSTLDGVSDIFEYIKYAESYKIKSLTLTDHNSVQSFPDASLVSKETNVNINYGVEMDIYDDLNTKIVINERDEELVDAEYVFFDLETTSLSAAYGEIIEFGAVKFKNNNVIDRKQIFIKPKLKISEFTTSLTSITNEDLINAPKLNEVIREIKDWIGNSILVAHNAIFDFNFLNKAYLENGLGRIKNPIIDSMKISWLLHPKSRSHKLGTLSKHEFINYDESVAHRANYDAEILSKVYERMLHKLLSKKKIRTLIQLNEKSNTLKEYFFTKHITMISKNQEGLRDLNKLITMASTDEFNFRKKTPTLPLSWIVNNKDNLFNNLLIGSSCDNGFIFQWVVDNRCDLIENIINNFDYLEVFAPTSYKHLISGSILSNEEIIQTIKKIIKIGEKYNIPVIASSNAHYTSKFQKIFRDVLISSQRVGGTYHPQFNFKNSKSIKSDSHLRTTSELLKEFKDFLNEEDAKNIVINNTNKLQDLIDKNQDPIKKGLYPPKIEKAEEKLKKLINKNTKRLYGDDPNQLILDRIKKELDSILKHGFGIVYYLSSLAVKKSLEEGYLVGSRGSVGSSIVATLTDITEVNPLSPHYRCEKCKYHEFSNLADCGYDLPKKICPVCGDELIGDGHNIPFETFLGFNADKVPDIDLNFSRENQSIIHQYMKEVLGKENVYRAGTISTAAFKTAIGYVKKFEEINHINYNKSTIEWIAKNISGSKRTTGQHPGGLIVIPDDKEVYEFTAINYPGDDKNADWKTTHFDFHSIHDNLLKLDLLGHLDPSMIRMLENLTNVSPKKIPMNDKKVISLFKNNYNLNFKENLTNETLGIIGLPEFGTNFVRELVREAKPKSFSDLVRISGLSHGTNVWTNNAQNLIKNKKAILSDVISVRDDILTYLINKGIDNSISFNIMESVRKGNGLTNEWIEIMKKNNIPNWYIDSCKAIKYIFPKAHATAYVIMAYRIAWYKINYPLEYYATFFSKRDIEIDISIINNGIEAMKKHISLIKEKSKFDRNKKDEDLLETYNIIFEMYSRGIKFGNLDINKSSSSEFLIDKENNLIIPPFNVLEGVGEIVALNITKERIKKSYVSIDDFKKRSGLPTKIIKKIIDLNVFENCNFKNSKNEQLSLFE